MGLDSSEKGRGRELLGLRIGLSLHPQPYFSSEDASVTSRDLLLFPGVLAIPVYLGQQAQVYTRRPAQNEGAPHLSWIFNSGARCGRWDADMEAEGFGILKDVKRWKRRD